MKESLASIADTILIPPHCTVKIGTGLSFEIPDGYFAALFARSGIATKQGLRETEHVKVRNASAGWGKNVVYEMKKLSPEFSKRVKSDSEYSTIIDVLVEDIKTDYEERRNEIR